MKTKFYIFILLVGIGLTVWSVSNKNKGSEVSEDLENNEAQMEEKKDTVVAGNHFEGRLENSDDVKRGNLKLVSLIGDIYIRTSRDFSALIGLDVLMTIDGTLDKFNLVNIEKRLEKEGYIQSQ